MTVIQYIDFFIFHIMPPAILLIGWTGNITGLVVLFRRDLTKLGPLIMYRILLLSDAFYLSIVFVSYLNTFNIETVTASQLSCKLLNYIPLAQSIFSPFILVYISVDRFISIKNVKSKFLKKTYVQLAYCLILLIFEFLIYIPFYLYSDIYTNKDNFTNCFFFNSDSSRMLNFLIDAIVKDFLVFLLMLIFSIMLIFRIVRSHRRVMKNYTRAENRTFRKDVRLSITSILLNVIYIVFSFPANLVTYVFTFISYNVVIFFYNFYMINFALNFYLILATNSLFRHKVLSLFKRIASHTNQLKMTS